MTFNISTPTGESALNNERSSIVSTTFATAVNKMYINPSNDFFSQIIEVIKYDDENTSKKDIKNKIINLTLSLIKS